MTTPSANPRRFSRGSDNLDPEADLSVYMSLMVPKSIQAMRDTFAVIERYKADWPQALIAPVAMTDDDGHLLLILQVRMGPARLALTGKSPEVAAGYGILFTIAKGLYHLRPVFVGPPTDSERDAFTNLMKPAGRGSIRGDL